MDDIHARVPVDRLSARVIAQGVHFEPEKQVTANDSETPHRIVTDLRHLLQQPWFEDLTGRRVGRFTVIGLAADFKGRWVVRCDCGTYSTRRAKAIRNPENGQDRCEHCRHLAYLKRSDYRQQTGLDKDIKYF